MLPTLIETANTFVRASQDNRVQPDDAMREDLVGLQLFAEPIFAVGDAADPLFARLKEPEVVHPEVMLPHDWLPGARRVLSFFLPFTEAVKASNSRDYRMPSDEWLHGRIEGQMFVNQLGRRLRDRLAEAGYAAVFPPADERIQMITPLICNWSERHAAYICGLGTFSLSKALITARGAAGRFGSLITDCELPLTRRPYTGLYEYCNLCGECEEHCPGNAIDAGRGLNHAKDHVLCKQFVDTIEALPPRGKSQRIRYGCGKCQVGTPCQDGIP